MFKLLEPSHVIWFVFSELKKIILIKHSFFCSFHFGGLDALLWASLNIPDLFQWKRWLAVRRRPDQDSGPRECASLPWLALLPASRGTGVRHHPAHCKKVSHFSVIVVVHFKKVKWMPDSKKDSALTSIYWLVGASQLLTSLSWVSGSVYLTLSSGGGNIYI